MIIIIIICAIIIKPWVTWLPFPRDCAIEGGKEKVRIVIEGGIDVQPLFLFFLQDGCMSPIMCIIMGTVNISSASMTVTIGNYVLSNCTYQLSLPGPLFERRLIV